MMYDVLETVNILEEKYGVRVRSVSPKEGWMNTTDKSIRNLILAIFSWVAEREREMLSQRTKEGLARAKAEGVRLGRPERKINWVKVKELRSPDKHGRRVPYTVISRILDVPYPTLMAYKKDRNDLD
jgi:DNA invertase Pin-like site-specific DNA recombinase